MTAREHPPANSPSSTPKGISPAEPAAAEGGSGAPKVAARMGVPSSSDPHPADDGRRPVAWIHIAAPGRGATPTVRSWCICGRDLFTAGHTKALALIADHERHRTTCPKLNTTERKAA
ncbi:hypothetical protein [Streptomyces sp. NPDC048603]|uniref:hypothetical protein n=1 Tax=Streptomyces sp. NPDC048603 TaxID=3365577 RepID=UPI003715A5F7